MARTEGLADLATKNRLLALYWLPRARVSGVVITAPLTERFSAAPHATVGTDSDSTVSALGNSTIATGRANVAVASSVFDLAIHAALFN